MLDDLLKYSEEPLNDDFTRQVMQRVQQQAARQQKQRKLILLGTGVVGAAFGAAGAVMLSEPIGQFFSQLGAFEASVAVMSVVAFLTWLLHEEVGLGG